MKHTIIHTWQELAETFTIVDGELWRTLKSGKLKRVSTSSRSSEYIRVGLNGKLYLYHRLLYMLHHKVTLKATQVVDHVIEGDKFNNHIDNLQVIGYGDNIRKAIIYKLPKPVAGKYALRIRVDGYLVNLPSHSNESGYWVAHAKLQRLFGYGTKGLEYVKTLDKIDAKDFIKLAMVV